MDKRAKCKPNCEIIVIITIVILIVFPYMLRFYGSEFSFDSQDWGNFGSYFGGMVSLISVCLLYLTLKGQLKEYHRKTVEDSLNRQITAIKTLIKKDENIIQTIYAKLKEVINEPLVDKDSYTKEEAINKLKKSYEALIEQYGDIPVTYNCYKRLCYMLETLDSDDLLKSSDIVLFLRDIEFSLSIEVVAILVCMICNDGIKKIDLFARYGVFKDTMTDIYGFESIRDVAFGY